MPRAARAARGGVCYHVISRSDGRATVFAGPDDYRAFMALLGETVRLVDPRVIGFCLMPDHLHLVLWPRRDGDLSRFMQRLLTTHVRRRHAAHGTSGRLWHGRFKAFPIQAGRHLLAVLRYVERNALRARLVRRAEDWAWSSLAGRARRGGRAPFLRAGPRRLPGGWTGRVNAGEDADELARIRNSANRGTPFGDPRWQKRTAARLGIEASLRPRGRPRKPKKRDSLLP